MARLFARPRAGQPRRAAAGSGELIGVVEFLSQLGGLRIFVDLTVIAVCGGFFVVPLYAIIQQPQRRGGAGAHHRRR